MENLQATEDLIVVDHELVRATRGQRFANYIIDVIVFYVLLFVVGLLIGLMSPETLDSIPDDDGSFGLLDRLLFLALYGLYMSIVEAVFKGKSLGKLITGTRAVYEDGSYISAGTAFARGFSRAVPFAAFSALGDPCIPWQDKWTNTMVIDEKLSRL